MYIEKKSYHRGEHTAITPHIQTIVIFLKINEQLRSFEVPRCDANIVFRFGVVELSKTPIDETKL